VTPEQWWAGLSQDWHTVILGTATGVFGGLVTFYLARWIEKFRAFQRRSSISSQLQSAESELATLARLGESDRAVILWGFYAVLSVLTAVALANVVMIIPPLYHSRGYAELLAFILWVAVSSGSGWAASMIKKAARHDESVRLLEDRAAKLKEQLASAKPKSE
jgi:hypothetical protein